jgi:3-hydroxy-9,10-secoandrosta-1,3,5(10)-triene-9,17-dione monooxygenase reductase component
MQSHPPTSTDSFKALARTWAATVTVVTARRASASPEEAAAALDGFTATAFFTVSMAPPIIAVSATTAATAFTMLRDAEAFAVNLLAPDHADLAAAFAKPHVERAGLWDRIAWVEDAAGVPLLGGATGAFSARVRQLVDAGDHTIVLGDVTAIHVGEGSDTLVYHNRAYGRVARQG